MEFLLAFGKIIVSMIAVPAFILGCWLTKKVIKEDKPVTKLGILGISVSFEEK